MNKTTRWIIGLIIVLIVIILGYSGFKTSNVPTQLNPVKIGAILPLTGWGAYWGLSEQKGVDLAISDLEKSGKKIDIAIEDSATDAKQAVTAAQRLISIDNVDGLIVEFSGPTTAVAPLAYSSKTPFMYDAVVKTVLETNPFALKAYFDIEKQCGVAVEYFANHGFNKIAGIIPSLDFSQECKRGMTTAADKKGVSISFYDFVYGENYFNTIITKMKKDSIDAIVPVMYEDGALVFYKQKGQLNFKAPIFAGIAKDAMFTDRIIANTPAQFINGTIFYDQQVSSDFTARINKLYPSFTDSDILAVAYGYDQIMYMGRALEKCRKNPECVKNEIIKDKEYKSVISSDGFGSDRIMSPIPTYQQFQNGKIEQFDINK